jgi:hypothetical protein
MVLDLLQRLQSVARSPRNYHYSFRKRSGLQAVTIYSQSRGTMAAIWEESLAPITSEENRRRTALSTENYDFSLAGYENSPDGGRYVLDLLPKTKNRFLYRGKTWVEAKDFAVVRIEGEPGKSPSAWIKKTEIAHRYVKVNDFWLPAENHSESTIRVGEKQRCPSSIEITRLQEQLLCPRSRTRARIENHSSPLNLAEQTINPDFVRRLSKVR